MVVLLYSASSEPCPRVRRGSFGVDARRRRPRDRSEPSSSLLPPRLAASDCAPLSACAALAHGGARSRVVIAIFVRRPPHGRLMLQSSTAMPKDTHAAKPSLARRSPIDATNAALTRSPTAARSVVRFVQRWLTTRSGRRYHGHRRQSFVLSDIDECEPSAKQHADFGRLTELRAAMRTYDGPLSHP